MAILNDDEFVEVEGRYYSNPQVALDENNAFIDNLRSTQQANNQEIQTQTYNLGSELPSQLGGLGAPGNTSLSYFTSRYQVPQTNAAVANLRATAQAAALNEVLSNEQAKWKNRYQQAYRNYQKRQYNRSYGGGGGGGTTETPQTTAGQGSVDLVPTDDDTVVTYGGSVTAQPGQQVVIGPDGIAQMYLNGTEYVELKPGQTYKPTLNLVPTNSFGTPNSLAPVNQFQGRQ